MTRLILLLMIMYTVAVELESSQRFGMFEAGYWGTKGVEASNCNCASPPCRSTLADAIANLIAVCAIFITDFVLTSGFADGMRRQLRKVEASVEVAGKVTAALARYDVDEAEAAIKNDEHLPKELAESYQRLVGNLRSYKAYLHPSCLVIEETTTTTHTERASVMPPEEEPEEAQDIKSNSDDGSLTVSRLSGDSYPDGGSAGRVPSVLHPPAGSEVVRHMPHKARVSLVCSNLQNYLNLQDSIVRPDSDSFGDDVQCWCDSVHYLGGVVDLIAGDRRYASFNARKPCTMQENRALDLLIERRESQPAEIKTTGCVVTGNALCGDFGCRSLLRFMALGPVTSSLQPLERLAARWSQEAIVDANTQAGISGQSFLAIAVVMLPKRGKMPIPLYTYLPTDTAKADPEQPVPGSSGSRVMVYEDLTSRIESYEAESHSRIEEAMEVIRSEDLSSINAGPTDLLTGACQPWVVRDVGLMRIGRNATVDDYEN
eukprot:Hpha_TRINITY_DN15136_c3_g4::TRINITY_DN15136_c3_g4_i2::g.129005::m.129005